MRLNGSFQGCAFLLVAMASLTSVRAQQPTPPASPTPDPLAQIEAVVKAEHEARSSRDENPSAAGTQNSQESPDVLRARYLQSLRQATMQGDEERTFSALAQLRSGNASDELRKACDELGEAIKKTRAADKAVFDAKVWDALKRTGETALRAKEPKDLDAIHAELSGLLDYQAGLGRNLPTPRHVTTRVQAGVTFVERWQDYLFAAQRGDSAAVTNILRGLANSVDSSNQAPLVPRSEIIARIPPPPAASPSEAAPPREPRRASPELDAAVADILDKTHTLGDLPETLRKLGDLRKDASGKVPTGEYGSDLGAALNALRAIDRTRRDLEAGMAATITFTTYRSDDSARSALNARLAPLRLELVKLALPRLLNGVEEKPRAGEAVDAFLRRLIEAAKKRADWPVVERGLDILQALDAEQGVVGTADARESEAFKQFLVGLNMEGAGQYQQAAIAYLTALKSGAFGVPAPLVGEHLTAIEKAHPKEYADANAYVLNPPASSDTSAGQKTESEFRGRSRSSRSSAQPFSVFQVPAANVAPANSPSPKPGL